MVHIFARVPVPGVTKTRLIPALGAEGAAALASAMFVDTVRLVQASGLPFRVLVDGDPSHPWVRALDMPWARQAAGDLGARLHDALAHGGIAIGSDAPTLPPELLRQAHESSADVTLAPARDGGYVLVATRDPTALFDGVPWSSSHTFAAQRARALALGRSVHVLPGGFDVDTPDDLTFLRHELAQLPDDVAPATRAALRSLRG